MSHEAIEKVTIISSDSEPLPRQKIRRVNRKVRFSHPLAYQDPQFLLKQQQFESRRRTRNSKDVELSSGSPDVTRKRRTEVISDLRYAFLWRVLLVNHSILLTQTIRIRHLPLASLCNLICRLSKLPLGNVLLFTLCFTLLMPLYSSFCFCPQRTSETQ